MSITTDLLNLIEQLPIDLQLKIKMYYFSYGTDASRLIKPLFRVRRSIPYNPENTLWNLVVYDHGFVKCSIKELDKVPTSLYELEMAVLNKSKNMDIGLKNWLIDHYTSKLKTRVISKYTLLL